MPGKDNDKDHQLIHRFLEGELSEEEQHTVDQRVQTDSSFAEKVARLASSHQAARELRREELYRLYPQRAPRRSTLPWWVWVLIAAGLAAALYLGFGPAGASASDAPVALSTGLSAHQQAFIQSPGYFDEMGGSWKADYREGRYAEARRKLNALLDDADDLRNLSRFCYYAGLLNLYPETGLPDLSRAIIYFETARSEFQNATLYLIIAYAKAGQLQNARALADELAEEQLQRLPTDVRNLL